MTSSTIGSFIQTAVTSITDALGSALPYVLGLAGGLVALFLAWRIMKRFLGR